MFNPDYKDIFYYLEYIKDLIIGFFSGVVAYLFEYEKAIRNKEQVTFSFISLTISIILGCFIAYLVGTLIDKDIIYRDSIIALSAISSFKIIELSQTRVSDWIVDKLVDKK